MNRSSLTATLVAGLALGIVGTLTLSPREANAQQRVYAPDKVYRLVGDFDVHLKATFFMSLATPIEDQPGVVLVTDVSKIDLLDDWAVLTKRQAAREITFIVPREEITYINAENR